MAVALIGSALASGASSRLLRAGALDPSFDGDGRVVTALDSSLELRGLVAEPDRGSVAVGVLNPNHEFPGGPDVVLIRYRADGTLDPAFGTDGKVETDLPGTSEEPFALARRRGGGYVVAGVTAASADEDLESPRGILLGYRADGTLDPGFGRDGAVLIAAPPCTGTAAVALTFDSAGRIVTGLQCSVGDRERFAVVRFASNGDPDLRFGVRTTAFAELDAYLQAVALQRDDKIVALGVVNDARPGPQRGAPVGSVLARYSPAGGLDRKFGRSGWVMIGPVGRQHRGMVALTIQPNRRIVVAGYATLGTGFSGGFALARYTDAGKVDESFGERGRVFSRFRFYAGVRALVYQRGTLLAAGDDWPVRPGSHHFAVARYVATNGKLDARFGKGGKLTTTFPESGDEAASALAIDSGGDVVVGGDGFDVANERFVLLLARYKTR